MPVRAPYLLILRSGSLRQIDRVAFYARLFSRHYEGEIVALSSVNQELAVDRMRVRTYAPPRRLPQAVRWLIHAGRLAGRGIWIRWALRRRPVVIACDPLRSGLVGLLLKWLAGAKFICEVNGVFGHPDTLIDLVDREEAERRRSRTLQLGSFVLRRADQVKLLYADQLRGFDVPDQAPPRACFHDIVDSHAFQPTGRAAGERLIFIGHPYLLKGVDLLLKAFSRASSSFPDWSLLIVGWRIEESARASGLPLDRVQFKGPQTPEQLRDLIEESAALVLPSRSEGMGRVLIEAALVGRARIGSRVGGIPTVIDEGIDGLLFEPGDVDDLARVLEEFMSASDEERTSMGARARDRAIREFTEEEFLLRYAEIIDRLLPQETS